MRPFALPFLLAAGVAGQAAAGVAVEVRVRPGEPGGLEAARARARMVAVLGGRPVNVVLESGTYPLTRTLALTVSDGGSAGAPVTWKAAPGARVRISGGREVSGWTSVTDAGILARLTPAVRSRVLVCDVRTQGVADFGMFRRRGFGQPNAASALELVVDDRILPQARHPTHGWLTVSATISGGDIERFAFADSAVAGWGRSADLWVHGYWTYDWADTHDPLVAFDPSAGQAAIRAPAGWYGVRTGARFAFENALEALDGPGEWWLDRTSGKVYLLPPGDTVPERSAVTLLEGPLIAVTGASHLRLEGLILEDTRGNGIEIAGGEACEVAGCTVRNLGGVGVTVRAGRHHRVRSCNIFGTGEGGIALAGGDRATLTSCEHAAENNDIHDYSRWSRTYRPGVQVDGVGCRVANNHLHDAPHNGILLGGNDHLIELNIVERVCLETGDSGAFYMGRDPTMRGTVIRHNIFRNLARTQARPGEFNEVMAVYLDDCACGTRVEENLFDHAGWGIMIGGGRDNAVLRNVFIGCEPAVSLDARALGWAKAYYQPGGGWEMERRLAAVPLASAVWRRRYPALAGYSLATSASPTGNRIEGNVCTGGRWLQLNDGVTAREAGAVNNLVESLTTTGRAPWPAIPLEHIGLVRDNLRAALPPD